MNSNLKCVYHVKPVVRMSFIHLPSQTRPKPERLSMEYALSFGECLSEDIFCAKFRLRIEVVGSLVIVNYVCIFKPFCFKVSRNTALMEFRHTLDVILHVLNIHSLKHSLF